MFFTDFYVLGVTWECLRMSGSVWGCLGGVRGNWKVLGDIRGGAGSLLSSILGSHK